MRTRRLVLPAQYLMTIDHLRFTVYVMPCEIAVIDGPRGSGLVVTMARINYNVGHYGAMWETTPVSCFAVAQNWSNLHRGITQYLSEMAPVV